MLKAIKKWKIKRLLLFYCYISASDGDELHYPSDMRWRKYSAQIIDTYKPNIEIYASISCKCYVSKLAYIISAFLLAVWIQTEN